MLPEVEASCLEIQFNPTYKVFEEPKWVSHRRALSAKGQHSWGARAGSQLEVDTLSLYRSKCLDRIYEVRLRGASRVSRVHPQPLPTGRKPVVRMLAAPLRCGEPPRRRDQRASQRLR